MIEEIYRPSTITTDAFLSELPLALMKENIKAQFKDPIDNSTDYVTIFIDKFNYFVDNLEDTDEDVDVEEAITELNQLRNNFISFMEKRIFKKLGIGIVDFEDLNEEDQNETIRMIYSYFILNIKKNFRNVVFNYIEKYKKSILLSINKTKKKDVTTLSLKKEISSQDDMDIISNLSEIIDLVLDMDIDIMQFIELSESEKNTVECQWLTEAYDNIKITGNFIDNYKKMISSDFKYDLEISVRNKILKKYRGK